MTEELYCSLCGNRLDYLHHEGPKPRVVICRDCFAAAERDEAVLKAAAKLVREAKE